jgi:hypothetical protein
MQDAAIKALQPSQQKKPGKYHENRRKWLIIEMDPIFKVILVK